MKTLQDPTGSTTYPIVRELEIALIRGQPLTDQQRKLVLLIVDAMGDLLLLGKENTGSTLFVESIVSMFKSIIEQADSKASVLEGKKDDLRLQINQLEDRLARMRADMREDHSQDMKATSDVIVGLRERIRTLEEDVERGGAMIDRQRSEIEDLQTTIQWLRGAKIKKRKPLHKEGT